MSTNWRSSAAKIRLPKRTLDRVEPHAAKEGVTVSTWIRVAVEQRLQKEEDA